MGEAGGEASGGNGSWGGGDKVVGDLVNMGIIEVFDVFL